MLNWLVRRKFLALLVALGLLLVLFPLTRDAFAERLLFDALLLLVFLAGYLAVFTDKRLRLPGLLLAVPPMLGLWVGYAFPGVPRQPLAVAFHAAAILFLSFVMVIAIRSVLRQERVTANDVYAALCGYLLLGLVFGHLYCAVEWLRPSSFHHAGELLENAGERQRLDFRLAYLSYMTLTTVGYGELTPNTDTARSLTLIEAVAGQFYVAVLIAELVGKRVGQTIADRTTDSRAASLKEEEKGP
jgi:hypothetical protein